MKRWGIENVVKSIVIFPGVCACLLFGQITKQENSSARYSSDHSFEHYMASGCKYMYYPCYPIDSDQWGWGFTHPQYSTQPSCPHTHNFFTWYHNFEHFHECYDCAYFEYLGDINPNCPCRNVSLLDKDALPPECFKRPSCRRFLGSYSSEEKIRPLNSNPKCLTSLVKSVADVRIRDEAVHDAKDPLAKARNFDDNCQGPSLDDYCYCQHTYGCHDYGHNNCYYCRRLRDTICHRHNILVNNQPIFETTIEHVNFCAEGVGFHAPTQQKVLLRTQDGGEYCSWCGAAGTVHGQASETDSYHGYVDYHLTFFRRCVGERCNNRIMDLKTERPDRKKSASWRHYKIDSPFQPPLPKRSPANGLHQGRYALLAVEFGALLPQFWFASTVRLYM